MQPYFFPYIGYWQLIKAVDIFVIFDDVNYINKGYINRNSILIDGQPKRFTLELSGASQNKHINELLIGNNCEKLLKTISLAYRKAPRYAEIYPLLAKIILNKERNLAKYVGYSIQEIARQIGIGTKILYSSSIEKCPTLKGQDKILAIVKKLEGNHYLNAIGGRHLYEKDRF